MTRNQSKKQEIRKKHFFGKILSLYTIHNLYTALENIYGQFSFSLKIKAKQKILKLNLTVLCKQYIVFNTIYMRQGEKCSSVKN